MDIAPLCLIPSVASTFIASLTTAVTDKRVIAIAPGSAARGINFDTIGVSAATVTVPDHAVLARLGFGLLGLSGVACRREVA